MARQANGLRGAAPGDFLADFAQGLKAKLDPAASQHQGLDEEGKRLVVPAPNAIEWCTGREWCNAPTVYTHVRQYQIIRDFFQLRCPICNIGDSSTGAPGDCMPGGTPRTREYLEAEALLVWDADNNDDTCPKCGTTRTEFTVDGLFPGFNQLHVLAGQRAGKSFTSAFLGTYMEHRILTVAHSYPGGLHGYLELQSAEIFETTFLAATDVQSADTIWAKYFELRAQAPWFDRYRRWVKRHEAAQDAPSGAKPWRYEEQTKQIINEAPGVRMKINSLNSNSSGLRGRTRLAAFADEISHMQQTDSAQGADEVYRALENSLATVRGAAKTLNRQPWLGAMVSISSPKSRDDKGMRLYHASSKISKMYSGLYTTWDFNPTFKKEDFDDAKEKDPVGYRRDFLADPPGADSPLIHDPVRFEQLVINPDLHATATFQTYEFTDESGQEYVGIKLDKADFQSDRKINRYVCFDAGHTHDAFAGACAHGEWVVDSEGGERLVTVYDWIVRILPRAGLEVYFDSVFNLVRDLLKFQRVTRVEFDRWNSLQLIQQMRVKLGIVAEQKSTKGEHYTDFKTHAYGGLIAMIPPEAADEGLEPPYKSAQGVALYEIVGLQRDHLTGKVGNPHKGERRGWNSDDVAQAVVHVDQLVQVQGYTEKQDDMSVRARRNRMEASMTHSRGAIANHAQNRTAVRNWNSSKRGW